MRTSLGTFDERLETFNGRFFYNCLLHSHFRHFLTFSLTSLTFHVLHRLARFFTLFRHLSILWFLTLLTFSDLDGLRPDFLSRPKPFPQVFVLLRLQEVSKSVKKSVFAQTSESVRRVKKLQKRVKKCETRQHVSKASSTSRMFKKCEKV